MQSTSAIPYLLGLLAAPGWTRPALAQDAPAFSAAFSYASQLDGADPHLYAAGWKIDLASRVTPSWQIAGEVSRADRDVIRPVGETRRRLTLGSLLLGARWNRHLSGGRTMLVQMVVGEVRLSRRLTGCGILVPPCSGDGTGVRSQLAIQPGVGVELPLQGPVRMRLQGDYRLLIGRGPEHGLQVSAGLAVAFRPAP